MQLVLATNILLAASVLALQVTSPSKGDKLDLNGSNQVSWDSVESDPTSFDIQLVNEHVNPPVIKTIATDVQTSAGSYTFSNVATAVGNGYQINLVSTEPENTGILAQSAQFDVSSAVNSNSTGSITTTSTTSSSSTTTTASSSSSVSSSASTTSTASSSASSSGIRTSSSKTATTTSTSTSSTTSSGVSATHTGAAGTVAVPILGCLLGSLVVFVF